MIWLAVMAWWTKKVTGSAKAFAWSMAYLLLIPLLMVLGFVAGIVAVIEHIPVKELTDPLGLIARLTGFVLYIAAAYTLRSQLENSPINIPLGGVMTFFFSATYFQYHLHDFHWEAGSTEARARLSEDSLGLAGPMAPIVTDSATALPSGQEGAEKSY